MVVEYIRYVVPVERAEEFEAAYGRAGAPLDLDEHCLGYEVARGVEEPEHFVVRINWDSVDGHERGFRGGPHFGAFFAAVKPFFSEIVEMRHYQPLDQPAEDGVGRG
ncbi:MAG: putative quinol monooxygenase [Actinomycetota bacterium]